MKKLVRFFRVQIPTGLFAAFVPLENFKGTRLESLYTGDLSAFVNSIVIIMIIVGGTAAALRLAYSGAMNFGKDFWQNRTNLKEMRVEIAIGLFILLSVWIVLNQINPNMLNLEFLFPKVPEAETAGTVTAPYGRGGMITGSRRLAVSAGECAPNPMFGGYARQMSCICAAESSGIAYRASATDITADGKPFSTGLYQINLTQNWVYCPGKAPLDCPSAFLGHNRNATVRNPDLYNRCVAAANARECSEATAQRLLNNSNGLDNWSAWKNGNQRTCI